MNKTSTQTIHKSEAQLHRASPSELDRVAALPPGKGDKDNPALTLGQIAAAAAERRRRIVEAGGRSPKKRITIFLDSDLVEFFRAIAQQGYQTRINEALRSYVVQQGATVGDPIDAIDSAMISLKTIRSAMKRKELQGSPPRGLAVSKSH